MQQPFAQKKDMETASLSDLQEKMKKFDDFVLQRYKTSEVARKILCDGKFMTSSLGEKIRECSKDFPSNKK
jgi:hypothetical protein